MKLELLGSSVITLCGTSAGGLALTQAGEGPKALIDLNKCPGLPGVASSKLERLAYRTLALPGSNAKPFTARPGTDPRGSRSAQLLPPLVVRRSCPCAFP